MHKLKKNYLFLFVIIIIGIVAGMLFSNVLSSDDQKLIYSRITSFFLNLKDNTPIDYLNNLLELLRNDLLYLTIIIIMSFSVIGIIFNNFILFLKSFILGFTIGSIINVYFYSGIVLSIFYVFPSKIINLILFGILVYHANNLSLKIFENIFKKKEHRFSLIIKNDLKIVGILTLLFLLNNLFEVFLTPFILKLFSFLIP